MNYFQLYTPVQHLRRATVEIGGICWIVFAKWEDVLQFPQVDPLTGLCSTAITLKPEKIWYEFKAIDRNREFKESLKASSAGPFWEMQLSGYLAGNNSSNTLAIAAMAFHQFVVMFKDRDGQIRFLGNVDSGADLEVQYTSGDRDASRKRTLVFSWEHPMPAPIYTGTLAAIQADIITIPFNEGDFNNDFNDDFN